MKLMVCYDGSNVAKDALQLAVDMGRRLDASITVVRSVSTKVSDDAERVDEIENGLESARAVIAEHGVACDTHLLIRGVSAGEDLAAFATEKAIDFVIIGIKRRSKVGKMLFGSTAQYVILKTHCPVISVK